MGLEDPLSRRATQVTNLDEPLRKALGPRTGNALAKGLGLETTGDLLRHYPRRYAQRGELTDLTELVEGEHVTVMAEVARVRTKPMRNRGKMVEVEVTDGKGKLTLAFFGRGGWRAKELLPGRRGLFAGKVSTFRGRRQLAHPDYELVGQDDLDRAARFAGALIPVYPAAKETKSWDIAKAVGVLLDTLRLDDPLPASLCERYGFLGLTTAYERIHRPRDTRDVKQAKDRLKWDEAFGLQLVLARRRRAAEALSATPRPVAGGGLLDAFDERLPFTLTPGQREVGAEIAADLERTHPMHRLLQGDVGAGKTVVALRAMLQAVDAGGQAALLAPTEVLAQQHHRSIAALLGPLAQAGQLGGADNATRLALLTGSQGAKARRAALLDAASGAAGIVVGTHALLEEHVRFADLALVVIDEQHRFGVEQRDALREKSGTGRPHVLVMTATPIPRTVAMTVYGDLDTSALTQLPEGRSPIETYVVPAADKPHFLDRTWQRIREEVGKGRQAYVVCPRIGDQDGGDGDGDGVPAGPDGAVGGDPGGEAGGDPGGDGARRPPLAVLDLAPGLTEGPLAGLRVGVLHGRLQPDDKDAVMRAFARGELDVLVATTVIEVGVDVPNASVMAVMDADRFGVSQLHQLRGRVGRGTVPGLCLLVTDLPEPSKARERLAAVAETLDGFELSRLDLEQRREGDVLGAVQSGRRSSLRLLTLLRDEELIRRARHEAAELVEADPDLAGHPGLAAEVARMLDEDRADYLEKT
jgi:ATP-dependent DNA helicase RecG